MQNRRMFDTQSKSDPTRTARHKVAKLLLRRKMIKMVPTLEPHELISHRDDLVGHGYASNEPGPDAVYGTDERFDSSDYTNVFPY